MFKVPKNKKSGKVQESKWDGKVVTGLHAIGRFTQEDILAGKKVRVDENGFHNFSDYWSDDDSESEGSVLSLPSSAKDEENKTKKIPGSGSSLHEMSSFASRPSSLGSDSEIARLLQSRLVASRTSSTSSEIARLPESRVVASRPNSTGSEVARPLQSRVAASEQSQNGSSVVTSDQATQQSSEKPSTNHKIARQLSPKKAAASQTKATKDESDSASTASTASSAVTKTLVVTGTDITGSLTKDTMADPPASALKNAKTRRKISYSEEELRRSPRKSLKHARKSSLGYVQEHISIETTSHLSQMTEDQETGEEADVGSATASQESEIEHKGKSPKTDGRNRSRSRLTSTRNRQSSSNSREQGVQEQGEIECRQSETEDHESSQSRIRPARSESGPSQEVENEEREALPEKAGVNLVDVENELVRALAEPDKAERDKPPSDKTLPLNQSRVENKSFAPQKEVNSKLRGVSRTCPKNSKRGDFDLNQLSKSCLEGFSKPEKQEKSKLVPVVELTKMGNKSTGNSNNRQQQTRKGLDSPDDSDSDAGEVVEENTQQSPLRSKLSKKGPKVAEEVPKIASQADDGSKVQRGGRKSGQDDIQPEETRRQTSRSPRKTKRPVVSNPGQTSDVASSVKDQDNKRTLRKRSARSSTRESGEVPLDDGATVSKSVAVSAAGDQESASQQFDEGSQAELEHEVDKPRRGRPPKKSNQTQSRKRSTTSTSAVSQSKDHEDQSEMHNKSKKSEQFAKPKEAAKPRKSSAKSTSSLNTIESESSVYPNSYESSKFSENERELIPLEDEHSQESRLSEESRPVTDKKSKSRKEPIRSLNSTHPADDVESSAYPTSTHSSSKFSHGHRFSSSASEELEHSVSQSRKNRTHTTKERKRTSVTDDVKSHEHSVDLDDSECGVYQYRSPVSGEGPSEESADTECTSTETDEPNPTGQEQNHKEMEVPQIRNERILVRNASLTEKKAGALENEESTEAGELKESRVQNKKNVESTCTEAGQLKESGVQNRKKSRRVSWMPDPITAKHSFTETSGAVAVEKKVVEKERNARGHSRFSEQEVQEAFEEQSPKKDGTRQSEQQTKPRLSFTSRVSLGAFSATSLSDYEDNSVFFSLKKTKSLSEEFMSDLSEPEFDVVNDDVVVDKNKTQVLNGRTGKEKAGKKVRKVIPKPKETSVKECKERDMESKEMVDENQNIVRQDVGDGENTEKMEEKAKNKRRRPAKKKDTKNTDNIDTDVHRKGNQKYQIEVLPQADEVENKENEIQNESNPMTADLSDSEETGHNAVPENVSSVGKGISKVSDGAQMNTEDDDDFGFGFDAVDGGDPEPASAQDVSGASRSFNFDEFLPEHAGGTQTPNKSEDSKKHPKSSPEKNQAAENLQGKLSPRKRSSKSTQGKQPSKTSPVKEVEELPASPWDHVKRQKKMKNTQSTPPEFNPTSTETADLDVHEVEPQTNKVTAQSKKTGRKKSEKGNTKQNTLEGTPSSTPNEENCSITALPKRKINKKGKKVTPYQKTTVNEVDSPVDAMEIPVDNLDDSDVIALPKRKINKKGKKVTPNQKTTVNDVDSPVDAMEIPVDNLDNSDVIVRKKRLPIRVIEESAHDSPDFAPAQEDSITAMDSSLEGLRMVKQTKSDRGRKRKAKPLNDSDFTPTLKTPKQGILKGTPVSGPGQRFRKSTGSGESFQRKKMPRKSVTYADTVLGGMDDSQDTRTPRLKSRLSFNGSLQHFAEMTVSQTPQPTRYSVKPNKIIVPSESPEGLRRSQRTRVKPLEWYKNERILYKKRQSGGFVIDTIQSPLAKNKKECNPPKVSALKSLSAYSKKLKSTRRKKRMSIHTNLPPDVKFCETEGEIQVVNPCTGDECIIDCVSSKDSYVYTGPNGLEPDPGDDFLIAKPISHPAFACGEVVIKPLKEKPPQYLHADTLVFYVVKGKVAVTIHETTSLLEDGSSFFVPQGNMYSIKNMRRNEAKLTFFQLKNDMSIAIT